MAPPPCSRCGEPAAVSFAGLWSTVGISPRLQKLSKSHSFCPSCIQAFFAFVATSPIPSLSESLSEAYTNIHSHPGATCESKSDVSFVPKEVHLPSQHHVSSQSTTERAPQARVSFFARLSNE